MTLMNRSFYPKRGFEMSKIAQDEKLVSIIMPAYNCEKYIRDSINSVLNQTYQYWELIIIDDGSVDQTVNIVKNLTENEDRVHLYENHHNQGVSATRNKGIFLAKGEWIAFLDSDDIWDISKLQKQMNYLSPTTAEFLFTGSSYINEEGVSYKGVFEVPELVDYKKLRKHNVISCSSVLLKKHFFNNIKMEKDDMHEDYAVWLKILKTGICAYGINEPLLVYRISRNSKSGNKLKTIRMTYKVFRFIGMNPLGSAYFMCRHIIGSVLKYKKIMET
jgi:teichuronic acid biosynthesis glycosyltransferase TuaG